MKLFELSDQNVIGVYTEESDELYSILIVFNCDKTKLRNYIKEMLKESVEQDDETYEDVARNIDGVDTLQKFLKKKNVKSVQLDGLLDSGVSVLNIAQTMGKIK